MGVQVFVGVDWAEDHHDVFIEDDTGRRLGGGRLPEGVDGVTRFHEWVGAHADDPADVVIATETDRGLFIGALLAAGYAVLAVNPMSTSRYRERHSTSGAKSDLTASPGARAFYDQRRDAGDTHSRALRALANRLVGLLHGCLRHHALYDEHTAWVHRLTIAA